MNNPRVSVVIRTLNEEPQLRRLLESLHDQVSFSYGQIELIVVDNDSTDKTVEVAKEFGALVLTIPRDQFTFPKSLNLGVSHAHAPIVALTVGHALPVNAQWLLSGLSHFEDPNVAGVYGPTLPDHQSGTAERLLMKCAYWMEQLRDQAIIKRAHMGVLGATNAMVRRDLWQKHHFDERYELGGEDLAWARWALAKNYIIVKDVKFAIYHSHHLGIIGLIRQYQYWRKIMQPTKFSRDELHFRRDRSWR